VGGPAGTRPQLLALAVNLAALVEAVAVLRAAQARPAQVAAARDSASRLRALASVRAGQPAPPVQASRTRTSTSAAGVDHRLSAPPGGAEAARPATVDER
jgi:hypothetical protein